MTTETRIRRVHPDDAVALREFYGRLSPDSRQSRFLGCVRGLSTDQSSMFCTPDHMHAEGFVAISERPTDRGRILGHLCLEPAGEGRLELGVAVADAEQGHGIGRALFATALAWAMEHPYRSIAASCYAGNNRVLSLLSSAPHGAVIKPADAGVVNVTIPLVAALPADWSAPIRPAREHRRARRPVAAGSCHALWRPPDRDRDAHRGRAHVRER